MSTIAFLSEVTGVTGEMGVCFQCDRPVMSFDRGVEWRGTRYGGEDAHILFHAHCALHFLLRFARDIHELDLDEGVVPLGPRAAIGGGA